MGAACSCGSADATQPPASAAPQPAHANASSSTAATAPTTTDVAAASTVVNVAPASTTPAVVTTNANLSTEGITISNGAAASTTTTTATPAAAAVTTTAVNGTSSAASGAKVAVVYYSTWGHLRRLAEAVVKGARSTGADVTLYQIAETLPADVLAKMHAPPAPTDIPTITADLLPLYDGIIFGAPTRYGQVAAQYKALWDSTGQLWSTGALDGKLASFFVGTATMGGGQETTSSTQLGHFVHHGMIYVPMGYGDPNKPLFNNDVVHGGSPWGAGCLSNGDGSRPVSGMELGMGEYQGKRFAEIANAMAKGRGVA